MADSNETIHPLDQAVVGYNPPGGLLRGI